MGMGAEVDTSRRDRPRVAWLAARSRLVGSKKGLPAASTMARTSIAEASYDKGPAVSDNAIERLAILDRRIDDCVSRPGGSKGSMSRLWMLHCARRLKPGRRFEPRPFARTV